MERINEEDIQIARHSLNDNERLERGRYVCSRGKFAHEFQVLWLIELGEKIPSEVECKVHENNLAKLANV